MGRTRLVSFFIGCVLAFGFTFPATQCNAQQAQTPSFSPAGGSYSSAQAVTISDGTSGAKIYYTTDGSTPTTSSTRYSGPITLSTSKTLSAIAVATGYTNSAVGSATYTFGGISAPVFVQQCNGFQSYGTKLSCTLSNVRAGDALLIGFYGPTNLASVTTSSGSPTAIISDGYGSNAYILASASAGSITITGNVNDNERIWLSVAEFTNVAPSPIDTASAGACWGYCTYLTTYNLTTTADSDLLWSLCSGPSGISLHPGTAPITWNKLTSPSGSGEVLLVEDGLAGSAGTYYGQCNGGEIQNIVTVAIMGQTATLRAATPTFTPAAGSFTSAQTVSIGTTTPSATIYYTTDGTTPTTSSPVYTTPITVSSSETVKALAVASGYTESLVGSGLYAIGSLPAYVQECNSYESDGTSLSCTLTGVKPGDTLLIGFYGPTTLSSVTSSSGTPVNVISDGNGLNAYILSGISDETVTITGNIGDNEAMWLSAAEYTNVNSLPLDASATGACVGYCTSVSSQNLTTSAASDMLWSFCSAPEGSSITPGTAPISWAGLPIPGGSQSGVFAENGLAGASGMYYGQCVGASNIITVALLGSTAGPRAATPTFSLAAGNYGSPISVTLSTTTPSAAIYYTTDGSTPTTSSALYSGPININSSETVKAIASANGYAGSAVGSAVYSIGALPAYVQQCNNYQSSASSISCTLSGITAGDALLISFYGPTTLTSVTSSAGTTPINVVSDGESSNAYLLSNAPAGAITITGNVGASQTIWMSVLDYTNVAASPLDGSAVADCGSGCSVADTETFNTTAIGDMLWSLCSNSDGGTLGPGTAPINWNALSTPSDPQASLLMENGLTTEAGTYYGECSNTDNIIAVALKGGGQTVAATPTFSPVGGTYAAIQTVTISTTTPSATIYYTTDGSIPTASSNAYSGPITVSSSETIQAIATASGYIQSAVGSVAYTINAPISVSVAPSSISLYAGQSQKFTASVINTTNTSVNWTISPSGMGSVDSTGLYTAPTTISASQTVTITATSQADASKSASSTVNLLPTCPSSAYSYVRAIVINHTEVPSTDQANFPFLFSTTDSALATTTNGGHVNNPNGYDIIFSTDPAGQHLLSYEMEEYNPATGQVIAWVNLPTLSHSSDTVLYISYGNPAITTSQQDPAAVWDSNYLGVWHLPNGNVLSTNDSTANGNNGTNSSATAIAGQVDGAASFDGSSSYISVVPGISTAQMNTVSTWAYINSLSSAQELISHSGNGSGIEVLVYNGSICGYVMGSTQSNVCSSSGAQIPGWNHIVLTQGGPSSPMALYINGVAVAGSTTPSSIANPPNLDFGVWANASGRYFKGNLDEVRISNTVRSAGWIAAEYRNQSSPATFYTLYAENTETVVPSAVTLYSSQSQQFVVSDTCSSSVTWSMQSGAQGTVTSGGLYAAPTTITTQQTDTVVATSEPSGTTIGSATISLVPPISPNGGPAGTVVTINGVGFGTSEGSSIVTVGGFPAVTLAWSDTQIQAQIPNGTGLGNKDVVVTVGGQTVADETFTVSSGLVGITTSNNGTWASATIAAPGQSAPLIINGVAGQQINAWIVNSTFAGCFNVQISIIKPDGSTLGSSSPCDASATGVTDLTLPTDGIYTVLLQPLNGSTGSTNLVISGEQSGTVALGIPASLVLPTPGQEDFLTFSGTAGQMINAWLVNSTFGGCFPISITVISPSGAKLGSGSPCDSSAGGITGLTLPVTGTYTIIVEPNNGQTGTTNLILSGEITGAITPGVSTPVTFNFPGQEALLTFFGGTGQVTGLKISGINFGGGCQLTFSSLKPNGSTLESGLWCGGATASLNPITMPATGTYTLVVTPQNGNTGSATLLLSVTSPKAVSMNASLAPAESYSGTTVMVNLNLTTSSAAVPTGTVACAGSGIASAAVFVSQLGTAVVPMNGLPIGKDSISCSFTSNNPSAFSNAASSPVIESVTPSPTAGEVTVNPASTVLYGGQNQQFAASVFNSGNQLVTWTVSPAGSGTISSTGLYSAPATISVPQTIMVVATSQADPIKLGTASITLTPAQCAANGYGYQRSIVIDHTKVPNTDQTNFPFLFNTTDPTLATTGNGGHVSNPNGYDIFFSTDPAGRTKLDHELTQYDPVHGTVIAWIRVPLVSHSADTVIYIFYGNASVTTPQQNPSGVWDDGFTGVYHLTNLSSGTAADSTAHGNASTLASVSSASGAIDLGGAFNGSSSYMQVPSADFQAYPTTGSTSTGFSATFSTWFKSGTSGVILGQTDGTAPGGNPGQWQPALYIDTAGHLRASMFAHGSTSNQIVTTATFADNAWHLLVDTYVNGTEQLYVDGQFAGAQQVTESGYSATYSYFVGTGETANWPAENGSWSYFNGNLDEVTVSSIARPTDWVQATYSNQSAPSTFYSLHPENAVEALPGTVTLYDAQSQQFRLMGSVAGSCTVPDVIWSMPSGMQGTLASNGLYTAPDTISSEQTVPITATILGGNSTSVSASLTLAPVVHVSVTPGIAALAAGQTQQFTASVVNSANSAVTWTLNPVGVGSIDATGIYTAPSALASQENVTVTATTQADPNQSASATISLSPTPITFSSIPCTSGGFAYQRVIVIDHTKVPNSDLENFPFLFNTTDPSLATTANGGQVSSSSGDDIFFSTDANGLTKLDHELESYDPVHGQVVAWVRIPKLSHSADTVLYMFYGNPNVTWPLQNPTGVWDSDFTGVYHLSSLDANNSNSDSTINANNLTSLTSVSPVSGEIAGAAGFNGSSSSIQLPETDFQNYPFGSYNQIGLPDPAEQKTFSTSFGVWFKTASPGGILTQSTNLTCTFGVFGICVNTGPMQAGDTPDGSWDALMYIDENGHLNAGGLVSPNTYVDNNWHFAVWTLATSGTNSLYVDGRNVASAIGSGGPYAGDYAYYLGTTYTVEASQGNWGWLYFNGGLDEVTVSNTPRSADWIATEYNNQSSPSTFYSFNPSTSAQVVPSEISLFASQTQQFAATSACGGSVNWSMPSGTPGILSSSGLYTAPTQITSQQSAVITATSKADGSTVGTATVTLLPPPTPITLTASAPSPYTVGTAQTFTATLLDQDGTPQIGVPVTFSIAGSNNTIGSVTTGNNGVASFAYTGANPGTDTIQATAVVSDQVLSSNNISVSWLTPPPPTSAASIALVSPPAMGATGLMGVFTDDTGKVIEPLAIGSAAQTYVVPAGATRFQLGVNSEYYPSDGGPGYIVTVNGTSVTVPATAMPWTWALGGLNNAYQYGIYNPSVQNGILDGTAPVIAATGLTSGTTIRIAYQSGSASSNYPLAPLVGPNGDQTALTGANQWKGTYYPTLYTTTSSYPVNQPISFDTVVTDANGLPMANVPVTLTITGANAQQLNGTTDSNGVAAFLYAGTNPGTDTLEAQAYPTGGPDLISGQSNVIWTSYPTPPVPGSIQLSLLGTVEDRQDYVVLAKDSTGAPVQNASIALYAWGVDTFVQTGTTDSTGQVAFKYLHTTTGTYNLIAVESKDRNLVFSNFVNGQWAGPGASNGTGNTITIGISGSTSVILPNSLQVNGTVTDGSGLTPTITWSQVSGPGVATFANPSQAATSVTFSDLGTYVLELSASDASGNSGSVKWQIQVNPPLQEPQGWIGSPEYGSTVSGIVPIKLVPGVSLEGGALAYYPSSGDKTPIILNSSTTGSGQIGTLDTTQLPNGSYWIQLYATNTSGQSGYSLLLVNVAGEYKPGRVTTTVTDLVVPATGLSINIQRSYDSLNAGTSGDFGYGWNLGINTNLTVDPAGNVTFTLNGQRKTFYLAPQFNGFLPYYGVAYSPEPGLHGTLTDSSPGCADFFDFLVPNGSLWECVNGGPFNPPGYIYTDPNGTSYSISAAGNLQSIRDRSGNGLTITANGITSTTGLSVPFVRDSQNRITQITDPQGNIYQYAYDTAGNLASVTYPNSTTPNTYTYDSNHLYLSGTDFDNNPLPATGYYHSTVDSSGNCQGDCDPSGLPLNNRLKSVQDALGETTTYEYDLVKNTTKITYPPDANNNVGTATIAYDQLGNVLTSTDPLGHTTTNAYDSNQNLISTKDPLGHIATYTYDSNGNRTSVTYPKTATSTNTTSTAAFNQFKEPTSTTDELGHVRNYAYDANFNPQSITDVYNGHPATLLSSIYNSNGTMEAAAFGYDISAQPKNASQFAYDATGDLTSATDPLGRTTSFTYDSMGRRLTSIVPSASGTGSGTLTTYKYNSQGQIVEIDAPLGQTTYFGYDNNGNLTSVKDPKGNVYTGQYDVLNRLISITNPTQPATNWKFTYDFRNNLIDVTDPESHVRHNVYDLAGRLTSVTFANGTADASTFNFTYYDDGRLETATDARGNATNYAYDAAGNLTSQSGARGTFQVAYDDARNPISVTDGNGNTTQYSYDSRNQLSTITYPATTNNPSTTRSYTYDNAGNVASVTDQNGHVVQYTYDAANQLKSLIQMSHPIPAQNTNLYGYDGDGNLNSWSDENGHTTQSAFDALGRVTTKILPDGTSAESGGYDLNNNLSSLTRYSGKTTSYTYDTLNRLLSRAPDPTVTEPTVSYTYTANGFPATMTDGTGTTTYTYDNQDRLITKATPEGTLNYTYDAMGNVATMGSSDVNGVSVSYTYDDQNRLSTVVDNRLPSGANTTTYTYDPASNLATATYPNGLKSVYTYDQLNHLSGTATQASGYVYTRDNDGNKTLETELNGRNTNWSYDGINQLTTESVSSDPNQNKNGSVSYSLDAVGNRLSTTSSLSGISSSSSTFNADDRQSTEAYDSNGNVLSAGGKNYSYDSQNQLVSANAGTVGLVYDGMGDRVAKSANGATTHYLVDDLSPTGFPQVVQETVNGAVTRTYTYGLQRISQDQVISNNWTSSFYGYDGGGNVRLLTNSTGNITDTYEYDAFGNQISSTGSTPNEFLYRGEQWDPDLSLYYLRARYYNPVTGRFMSQDPYNGEVHDPASLHRYRYANGNPANFVDPSGQASVTEYANNVLSVLGRAAPVVEFANEVVCVYSAEAEGIDLVNNWQRDTRVQRAMRITALGLTAASCGAFIKGAGRLPEVEPIEPGAPETEPEPEEPPGCPSNPLFQPGPYAKNSIPARSPDQVFNEEERNWGDTEGYTNGCHSCGTDDPGTVSGHFVLDHQPVSALNSGDLPQRLYPQCLQCSIDQGLAVMRELRRLSKLKGGCK